METNFSPAQLADPRLAEANGIIKTCVHYGFCTNTCPTYVLLRDEKDSPRGRIDLIRGMLEKGGAPDATTVAHLDRCLSCLSCMTTCAAKVDYVHLIDRARAHIEAHYRRPLVDRLLRAFIAQILPYPRRLNIAMKLAPLGRLVARLDPRLNAMLRLRPTDAPAPPALSTKRRVYAPAGEMKQRVVLLTGCVQRVTANHVNEAAIRLLTRHGAEVVVLPAARCCGALSLHMGLEQEGQTAAWETIAAITEEIQRAPIDAVVITASGCGTTIKDYRHMFAQIAARTDDAARIAALAVDVSEFIARFEPSRVPAAHSLPYAVAYHDACSLQHGQRVTQQPRDLLKAAGFTVRDVPERHFCCGSAGTYNILQPALAEQLGRRKATNVESTGAEIVAAGNLGCMAQIALYSRLPVVHTVELLDWASGGPCPPALAGRDFKPVASNVTAADGISNEQTEAFW